MRIIITLIYFGAGVAFMFLLFFACVGGLNQLGGY